MTPKLKACLLVAPVLAIALSVVGLRWHGSAAVLATVGHVLEGHSPEPPQATLAFCRRAAELLHDVTWATTCNRLGEDSIDCTLPDRVAADVNALWRTEEQRCLAAEAQAGTVSLVPPSRPDEPTGRTARR